MEGSLRTRKWIIAVRTPFFVIRYVVIYSTLCFLYLMGALGTSKWIVAVRITPLCF